MQAYCWGIVTTAAIFWLWALANTAKNGKLDLGLLSFAYVFAAGVSGLISVSNPSTYAASLHLSLLRVGYPLVAANYVLGLALSEQLGLRIYCAIFAMMWSALADICIPMAKEWYKRNDTEVEYQAVSQADVEDHCSA